MSFFSSIAWRIALDVGSRGSFIVLTVLIARTLGVADYGRFGYAISLAQMFYTLTDFGTHLQLIKELGESRGRNQDIWKTYFDLKLILMGGTLVLFLLLGWTFWRWDSPWLFMMALLWMFNNSLLDFNQYVCSGLNRLDLAKSQLLFQRTAVLVAAGLALWLRPTLTWTMAGIVLGSTIGTALAHVHVFRKLNLSARFQTSWAEWRRILKVSFPTAVSGTFMTWRLRLGVIFLAWYFTDREVGEYSAAFRVFEAAYIIPGAIMAMGIPHLAAAASQGREIFMSELRRVALIMTPLAVACAATLSLLSPAIIRTVFGPPFSGAVPALTMLGLTAGVVTLNHITNYLMLIFNHQRRHALHEGLAFFVGLLLYLKWIHRGPVGPAIVLLSTESLMFLLGTTFLLSKRSTWIPSPEPVMNEEMAPS